MIDVYASPLIAVVKDVFAFWNWPNPSLPSGTMSGPLATLMLKEPISPYTD
jgi:hypothetical protein